MEARAMSSDDHLSALERPRYSYAEADRIAGVSRGTSKRWLKGYEYTTGAGERVRQPPVPDRGRVSEPGVSFLELIEVAAIGRLKDARLSLRQIREVVDAVRAELGDDHPLVTSRFLTDGQQVFVHADGGLVEVSPQRRRRAWIEVLEPFLRTVEYAGDIASRWWPRGRDRQIVVDPEYGFGLPVVAGTGVRTEILWEQWRAGESTEQIARDFGLDERDVEDALRFEASHAERATASTIG